MRTATCVICGAAFETNHPTKKTCSPTRCAARVKLYQRHYQRKRCQNPAYKAKRKARWREYYTKHRYDFEWHERLNAWARERYRRKHEHD